MAGFLKKLLTNTIGSVLPIAAVSVPVILVLIGGSLDISRVYMARNRLQSACDAATLAGRRAITTNGYDTTARDQAKAYFNTNFVEGDVGASGTVFTTDSSNNNNLITGSASTTVSTAVMNFVGVDTIPISVSCSATMGVGNSDITMVLDTTGSMGNMLSGTTQTRIEALRVAMKNFYDSVATATQGSNARIRYAFVPYSSSVNVGRLIFDLNPAYLADSWWLQTRQPKSSTTQSPSYSAETTGNTSQFSGTNYPTQAACNAAKPADTTWANNGNASNNQLSSNTVNGVTTTVTQMTQPQRRTTYLCVQQNPTRWRIFSYNTSRNYIVASTTVFYWSYERMELDTSAYKRFQTVSMPNGNNGAAMSYTWGGCIEERSTIPSSTFTYNADVGIEPNTAFDLNIDQIPNSPALRWGPLWPEMSYYRGTSSAPVTDAVTTIGVKSGSACPQKAQLLTSMDQTAFYAYADSLIANGSTYHDIGMLWGLRISSPQGPWSDTVNIQPTNGGTVSRHIIFMTDGAMEPNYLTQSAYGIEWLDRRITTDGTTAQATLRHTARFRALCDAAKGKGYRVWVIAFASSLTTDLTYCSSSNSAFLATNATQLNAAFQEIAKNVGELRVYQ